MHLSAKRQNTKLQAARGRLAQAVRASFNALADFAFPPECLLCQSLECESEAAFCDPCREKLVSSYSRCKKCSCPIPAVTVGEDCLECRKAGWKFDRVVTLGPYEEVLQQVVIRLKRPRQELLSNGVAKLLGEQLRHSVDHATGKASVPVILSVPYFWSHSWLGASDSAGELAKQISATTEFEWKSGLIRRIRKTSKQGMLTRSERMENVRGAFQIRESSAITDKHIVLVDDVLTTGATCGEIAKVLKKAGAKEVTVAVLARGTGSIVATTEPGLPDDQ